MTRRTLIPVLLAATAACAGPGSPIPVRGDVEPLVGRWEGEYSSRETGRVGSIVFTLRPGRDTATGDILMIPQSADMPPATPRDGDPTRRPPQLLQLSFVRCEGNEVTGWIKPYPDPDTGERVSTTFEGVLEGDRIAGTFVSRLELSGRQTSGTWEVRRRSADPDSR
jgi:hypothetical protein